MVRSATMTDYPNLQPEPSPMPRVPAIALAIVLTLLAPAAMAADKPLDGERDRTSYMVGMDVGRSLVGVGPDLDPAALDKAIRNAMDGGKPLIAEADAQPVASALMERQKARTAGAALPALPKTVTRQKMAWLVGADVGRSLAAMKGDVDPATVMRGIRVVLDKGTPLLDDAQFAAVRSDYIARNRARDVQKGEANLKAGQDFLAKNKLQPGVVTTRTGLQYKVMADGAGEHPLPVSTVRVNYEGRLLDGTVFDASKGSPAVFPLNRVIPGWTEGLQLMPVGAKYRFWIPAALAYGEKGSPPTIPPNATLVFDVQLLGLNR